MAGAVPRHYNVSEIKQKLMRPAQTSVYMVDVLTNPFVNSFVTDRGVSQTRHKDMINLACCEASLPGSSLATHEVNNDYHGSTEKMVYRRIYDDTIDLTFYVDHEYAVIKYFQGWMNYIVGEGEYFSSEQYKNPATFYRMSYPDGPRGYKSDIHLVKFEKDVSKNSPRPTIGYQFIKAFPINIVSTPISYDASDLLKVTVSFSYVRYVMEDRFSPFYGNASRIPPTVTGSDAATLASGGVQDAFKSFDPYSPENQAIFNKAYSSDLNLNFGNLSPGTLTNTNFNPSTSATFNKDAYTSNFNLF
jgi:hypothetical protein